MGFCRPGMRDGFVPDAFSHGSPWARLLFLDIRIPVRHQMKSLFFAVLLSAHFASAMEIPDVIRVDGRDNTGEVTVSDDGLVTVCSTGLISTVELRWRQGVSCAARVLGGEWERTYGRSGWSKLDPDRALPWYFLAADGVRVDERRSPAA